MYPDEYPYKCPFWDSDSPYNSFCPYALIPGTPMFYGGITGQHGLPIEAYQRIAEKMKYKALLNPWG